VPQSPIANNANDSKCEQSVQFTSIWDVNGALHCNDAVLRCAAVEAFTKCPYLIKLAACDRTNSQKLLVEVGGFTMW